MARKRYAIPQYGTVIMAGKEYYRTRIEDADGKRVALYLSLIHISEPTRRVGISRMPSSA